MAYSTSACRILLLASVDTRVSDMHRNLALMLPHPQRMIHVRCSNHQHMYFDGYASLCDFYVPIIPVSGQITSLRQVSSEVMKIKKFKTSDGKRAFSYYGPYAWNSLPVDVCDISKFDSFKFHLCKNYVVLFENHPT